MLGRVLSVVSSQWILPFSFSFRMESSPFRLLVISVASHSQYTKTVPSVHARIRICLCLSIRFYPCFSLRGPFKIASRLVRIPILYGPTPDLHFTPLHIPIITLAFTISTWPLSSSFLSSQILSSAGVSSSHAQLYHHTHRNFT
jgi:hypothetical protein